MAEENRRPPVRSQSAYCFMIVVMAKQAHVPQI